jgi:hypothetical protein
MIAFGSALQYLEDLSFNELNNFIFVELLLVAEIA